MSRFVSPASQPELCFPRVSGDEPGTSPFETTLAAFSPRERG